MRQNSNNYTSDILDLETSFQVSIPLLENIFLGMAINLKFSQLKKAKRFNGF